MAELDEMRQHLNLLSDEELLSILRQNDQEQWRPEALDIVRSILNERGVSPAEESAEPDSALELEFPEDAEFTDFVTVAGYANYLDAETDRMTLESKGLQAWISKLDRPVAHDSPVEGVQLKVRKEDWRAAMDLLELTPEQPVPSSDLPEDIAEPPCPKCKSRNVTEHAEISGSVGQVWVYKCASCGHKWDAEP